MAKALHNAGCPVWRMEFNLTTVARGLGLPGTQARRLLTRACACSAHRSHHTRCPASRQFAVFPAFILVTFSRLLSFGHGGKTLYIRTSPVRNSKCPLAACITRTADARVAAAARRG